MQQRIRWILFIFTCCSIQMIALAVNAEEPNGDHHYYDLNGNSLEQYDSLWETLHEYYGEHLPKVLTLGYIEGESSLFDPQNNRVNLAVRELYHPAGRRVIAHESSHIALYHLTAGASSLEPFRFFDEGQANIMGALAADALGDYKDLALNAAAIQYSKGNVSLERVQRWSSYYGEPDSRNPYAYDVGASFNFFILEIYGQEALFRFFEDIGKTRDLSQTVRNLFNKSAGDFEAEWLQYLLEIDTSLVRPAVVEMYPPHNAESVPVDVKEIYVRFNTEMLPSICILTPSCQDSAVCYKNAYWKAKNILAVKVQGRLKPGHLYRLSLGVPQKCDNKSVAGVELPITPWYFKTAPK